MYIEENRKDEKEINNNNKGRVLYYVHFRLVKMEQKPTK